jgi:hypothetical protein
MKAVSHDCVFVIVMVVHVVVVVDGNAVITAVLSLVVSDMTR